MVTDEMAKKAWSAYWQRDDKRRSSSSFDNMRAALEAVAPMIRAATLEEAATMVETHAYTVANREPYYSLRPDRNAIHDNHHATVAAAIRALKDKERT